MQKDFDSWNKSKKNLNNSGFTTFGHPREVWWCSLGLNIGVEIDGKHDNYERPVVIVKVYSKDSMLVVPLTSKTKKVPYRVELPTKYGIRGAKLNQLRVISNKRLIRRIEILPEEVFSILKKCLIASI